MMKAVRKTPIRSSISNDDNFSGMISDFLELKNITIHYNERLARKGRAIRQYVAIAFLLGFAVGMLIFK